jgi:hypothetical protein
MIKGEGVVFSLIARPIFQRMCRLWLPCRGPALTDCFAARDLLKTGKAKNTPAHPGKFPLAPPSLFASACAAPPVKGCFAFRYATLHSTLDLSPLLRPSLLTTAAPREISPQGRK